MDGAGELQVQELLLRGFRFGELCTGVSRRYMLLDVVLCCQLRISEKFLTFLVPAVLDANVSRDLWI